MRTAVGQSLNPVQSVVKWYLRKRCQGTSNAALIETVNADRIPKTSAIRTCTEDSSPVRTAKTKWIYKPVTEYLQNAHH